MSETIPEDILKTAWLVRDEAAYDPGAAVDAIARALMAERNRCAQIADDVHQRKQDESVDASRRSDLKRASSAQAFTAATIAAAIRNARS